MCLHLLHLQESCSQVFPRNEFSEHLSLNSQAPHRALGFECVSSATTRGQASVSGGALALKGRRVQRKLSAPAPAVTWICFQMEKYMRSSPDSLFVFPSLVPDPSAHLSFSFLFPPSQSPSDCNKQASSPGHPRQKFNPQKQIKRR